MDRARLDLNIEAIRKYRDRNPMLRQAHHFLYDLPLEKGGGLPKVVVMGINPGETKSDRDACPGPTEETWQHDFHETSKQGRGRGSVRWRKNIEFFTLGYPVVQTELFFWSSNGQAEFKKRFGPLWKSQHLSFCVDMNRSLLDIYKPRFVIFVGLSDSTRIAKEYGLRLVSRMKEHSHRLVDHHEDNYRSWFFTKHWTAAYGFSQRQKDEIRTYIKAQTAFLK